MRRRGSGSIVQIDDLECDIYNESASYILLQWQGEERLICNTVSVAEFLLARVVSKMKLNCIKPNYTEGFQAPWFIWFNGRYALRDCVMLQTEMIKIYNPPHRIAPCPRPCQPHILFSFIIFKQNVTLVVCCVLIILCPCAKVGIFTASKYVRYVASRCLAY